MTFSIIAYDRVTDQVGVAAATGNLLVGQFVPHCLHGIGVVASQGYTPDPGLALKCLQQLAENDSITALEDTYHQLSVDPGVQILAMNMRGEAWGHTGDSNLDCKHILIEDNLAVAGNWLSGQNVLTRMIDCYYENPDLDLGWRLIACLDKARESGSDRRGTYSAALKLDDGKTMPVDLRIDYSQDPIEDLSQVYTRWHDADYQAFLNRLPSNPLKHYKHLLRGRQ